MTAISGTRRAMRDRFNVKWLANPATGCHEWIACRLPNGYGAIQVAGKKRGAHRFSWEIHCGQIPQGLHVLHRCDNRKCVNPEHLFLGTHQQNMADRDAKGRQARPVGELNPMAKLTDGQRAAAVHEYLHGQAPMQDIADRYGVTVFAIYRMTGARRRQVRKEARV